MPRRRLVMYHPVDVRLIDALLIHRVARARRACVAGAAELIVPRQVGMALAYPADSETNAAVLVHFL